MLSSQVHIIEARELAAKDYGGTSDPVAFVDKLVNPMYLDGQHVDFLFRSADPLDWFQDFVVETSFTSLNGVAGDSLDPGWPTHVAKAIKDLVLSDASQKCLCHPKDRKKLNVADALAVLTSSLAASGDDAGGGSGPPEGAASSTAPVASQAPAVSPAHTPLSLQVHGLRGAEAPEQSVKRNVSEAFDGCLRRLDKLFARSGAGTPADFLERIDHWHASCGLPEEVRSRMQMLRIWRNASLHHDDQRWARDGPRSAEEASQHIAELDARIRALEQGHRVP